MLIIKECGAGFNNQVVLGELIDVLEKLKTKHTEVTFVQGFCSPHSYRGDYYDLGLEPKDNVNLEDMLECLYGVLDTELHGYKGGEFLMYRGVSCYIAYRGCTGQQLIGLIECDDSTQELGKYKLLTQNY